MVLTDTQLHEVAKKYLAPYRPDCINPASIDLTLGTTYRVPVLAAGVSWWQRLRAMLRHHALPYQWSESRAIGAGIGLYPGRFILCDTAETLTLPHDLVGFLHLKSTSGRRGLEHLHAGYIDPGFCGTLTLELINHWPGVLWLCPGDRLVQLEIQTCLPPERDYTVTGHYHRQRGPTPPYIQ